MTNEEARKILVQNTESLKANPLVTVDDCLYEAFDVAIKALDQQPSDDCISREDTLKEFKRVYFDNATVIRCAELILGGMPSVTPTSEDIKEAYLKGYDYGVKDWFKSKTQPCEDAISREAVIKNIKGWFDKIELNPDILIDSIVTLPPVTPQRPKGKWMVYAKVEFGDFKDTEKYKCSECGHEVGVFLSRYCPNCGSYNGGNDNGDE